MSLFSSVNKPTLCQHMCIQFLFSGFSGVAGIIVVHLFLA